MNFKASASAALTVLILFGGIVEASYDLPKIKIEKKIPADKVDEKQKKVLKGDWYDAKLFEQKIKAILEKNPTLPPSSPERIATDKNLIFIAFYKNYAYFLDKYSIKIIKDSEKEKSWTQHIFPVGEKISSKNSRLTLQKFCFDGENFYNSSRRKNDLKNVTDAEDKLFLEECFKVGYYYAFREEVD